MFACDPRTERIGTDGKVLSAGCSPVIKGKSPGEGEDRERGMVGRIGREGW